MVDLSLPEYRFEVGATVRVQYRALKREDLHQLWPDSATVLGAEEDGDALRYRLRHEKTGRELTVESGEVFGECGCAWPGYSGGCLALIKHGPGHQSHTHCRLAAGHGGVHETVYGRDRQFTTWTGDEVFTGFFDEPPEETDG